MLLIIVLAFQSAFNFNESRFTCKTELFSEGGLKLFGLKCWTNLEEANCVCPICELSTLTARATAKV